MNSLAVIEAVAWKTLERWTFFEFEL